eukprot:GHVR01182706.1.p1 GENE.GHVR01182706.1~~GHVR01182706.1.p1  ORF type:complete len:306 (+),score=84.65 GHVR01182706.1:268-1185(+)
MWVLSRWLETYPKLLIVSADNVGSKQMANVRIALRGKAVILFGKNTMIRRCLQDHSEKHPEYKDLKELIKLNIGFIFCITDINEIRNIVLQHKVPAAARQGANATVDVHIPSGPCGLDPSQTSFFQALGIPTKITKGVIELMQEVHLIKYGTKVAASQAALLQKLGIKPFEYGLVIEHIYDNGSIYSVDVLDMTTSVLSSKFINGVRNVAALSMATHIPTQAAVPHMLLKAYKNCVGLSLEGGVVFPQMSKIKEYLDDPSKFQTNTNTGGGAMTGASGAKAGGAVKAAPPVEEEEEEAMDFDLFD